MRRCDQRRQWRNLLAPGVVIGQPAPPTPYRQTLLRHRATPTAELHSTLAHDIGHVVRTHCPMQWKSWKVMPDEIKIEVRGQLSTN
ncbi:unnamed protein product [Prunus brigantina]